LQQKEIYLKNYWSLFLDFINVFADLTYNNIPLPILANFYQHLDQTLKEEMTKPDFKKYLSRKSLDNTQIQAQFERWLNPLKLPSKTKPSQGKVLLNFDYLRFSQNSYSHFSPKETVIFARFDKKDHLGIPIHCIKHYSVDVQQIIDKLVKKANGIFSSVNTHPVYNNQYLKTSFINKIPLMVEQIAAVSRYFDKNPISCIIVGTTEDLISRILTIIAASKGIPSICLQHGILGGPEAYLPVFSTKVAVYGQYEKDWYIERGLPENRIAITGHPRFDDIFIQNHLPRTDFQKKYNLNPQKKYVLLATQPGNILLWSKLIEILAKQREIEVIIKPHPWELSRGPDRMAVYELYSNKYQSVKLILKKGVNLYDILANVDIVVVNLSTAGLEAMMFRKPLFILSDMPFDYYDKMKDFTSSSPTKLAQLITRFFKDYRLQQLAHNKISEFLTYAYPQNMSAVSLLKEINKLIKT
jgi:hypothetical protein